MSASMRAWFVVRACLAILCLVPGAVVAQTALSVEGEVRSSTTGFRFPDGSIQATAGLENPAPVERTGATSCYQASGDPRDCAGTGEDGEHQAGVAWPSPRFVDLGDGTILDRLTNLVWLKDTECIGGTATWQAALTWVVLTLNFAPLVDCVDYTPGTHQDWRLANARELMSLVDFGRWGPAVSPDHLFLGTLGKTWSSSTYALGTTAAWMVNLNEGRRIARNKSESNRVLAVRGGAP